MEKFSIQVQEQLGKVINILKKLNPQEWAYVKERVEASIEDQPKTYNSTEEIHNKNNGENL